MLPSPHRLPTAHGRVGAGSLEAAAASPRRIQADGREIDAGKVRLEVWADAPLATSKGATAEWEGEEAHGGLLSGAAGGSTWRAAHGGQHTAGCHPAHTQTGPRTRGASSRAPPSRAWPAGPPLQLRPRWPLPQRAPRLRERRVPALGPVGAAPTPQAVRGVERARGRRGCPLLAAALPRWQAAGSLLLIWSTAAPMQLQVQPGPQLLAAAPPQVAAAVQGQVRGRLSQVVQPQAGAPALGQVAPPLRPAGTGSVHALVTAQVQVRAMCRAREARGRGTLRGAGPGVDVSTLSMGDPGACRHGRTCAAHAAAPTCAVRLARCPLPGCRKGRAGCGRQLGEAAESVLSQLDVTRGAIGCGAVVNDSHCGQAGGGRRGLRRVGQLAAGRAAGAGVPVTLLRPNEMHLPQAAGYARSDTAAVWMVKYGDTSRPQASSRTCDGRMLSGSAADSSARCAGSAGAAAALPATGSGSAAGAGSAGIGWACCRRLWGAVLEA